jgi:hypothetical protein
VLSLNCLPSIWFISAASSLHRHCYHVLINRFIMAFRNDPRLALVMGSVSRGHCCVCRTLLTFTTSDQIVYCVTCRSSMNHVRFSSRTSSTLLPFQPALHFSISCHVRVEISYPAPSLLPCLLQRTCPRCTTSLMFPINVQNVECGRCGFNTVFPPENVQRRNQAREPSHRLLTCVNCRTSISFPSDAPAVKCVVFPQFILLVITMSFIFTRLSLLSGAVFVIMSHG